MTCCLCDKIALRRVGKSGFCREHYDAALAYRTTLAHARDRQRQEFLDERSRNRRKT